jgi:hypothetical protein
LVLQRLNRLTHRLLFHRAVEPARLISAGWVSEFDVTSTVRAAGAHRPPVDEVRGHFHPVGFAVITKEL